MGEVTYVLARRRYGLPEQTETYLARKLREELLLGPRMSVMVVAVGLRLGLRWHGAPTVSSATLARVQSRAGLGGRAGPSWGGRA